MEHTFEELKKKTVAELREIARDVEHEAVQGYTQMNKEHLLTALCNALHIDMHAHHRAVGIAKTKIKTEIKELKEQRDAALAAHDRPQLQTLRRRIHALKRRLRKAMV